LECHHVPHPMGCQRGTMKTFQRLARVAYTFVMMNYAAIAGLIALRRGREVWK